MFCCSYILISMFCYSAIHIVKNMRVLECVILRRSFFRSRVVICARVSWIVSNSCSVSRLILLLSRALILLPSRASLASFNAPQNPSTPQNPRSVAQLTLRSFWDMQMRSGIPILSWRFQNQKRAAFSCLSNDADFLEQAMLEGFQQCVLIHLNFIKYKMTYAPSTRFYLLFPYSTIEILLICEQETSPPV